MPFGDANFGYPPGSGGGGGGGVTSLNGKVGAVNLTSTGASVTITTPTPNSINLEVSSGGIPAGASGDVQYNDGAGNFGADSGFNRDPITFDTICGKIFAMTNTSYYHLGTEMFSFGNVDGSMNVSTDASAGNHSICGSGDMSALVPGINSSYLITSNGSGDIAHVINYFTGGQPEILLAAYTANTPSNGLTTRLNPNRFSLESTGTLLYMDHMDGILNVANSIDTPIIGHPASNITLSSSVDAGAHDILNSNILASNYIHDVVGNPRFEFVSDILTGAPFRLGSSFQANTNVMYMNDGSGSGGGSFYGDGGFLINFASINVDTIRDAGNTLQIDFASSELNFRTQSLFHGNSIYMNDGSGMGGNTIFGDGGDIQQFNNIYDTSAQVSIDLANRKLVAGGVTQLDWSDFTKPTVPDGVYGGTAITSITMVGGRITAISGI